jgi:glutamate synthase (NADPH/NADH) large chain
MSKMGISTLQSYQSSQIFEALGIGSDVIERCFRGTISRIEGISFDDLAKEVLIRHDLAYENQRNELQVGGIYQWKRRGEKHLFSPEIIHLLQHSTKSNNYQLYKKYSDKINNLAEDTITFRGLLEFKKRELRFR